ncbi:hypothetical protein CCUS01_04165 [Colletotrichum cuscutae]|uniref:Uncharacterized protein n=1 Tax=Colletotrichum cuscutae TaxID=1209917 RepID=A0AAI9Y3W3_9PEZI|nr:hypothetical protein CCUS01_04165 [Colletotrichum cuscutae]
MPLTSPHLYRPLCPKSWHTQSDLNPPTLGGWSSVTAYRRVAFAPASSTLGHGRSRPNGWTTQEWFPTGHLWLPLRLRKLSADASSTMMSPDLESLIHRESIKVHVPSNLAMIVLGSSITEPPD